MLLCQRRKDDLLDLRKSDHLGSCIRSTMLLIVAVKSRLKSQLSVFTKKKTLLTSIYRYLAWLSQVHNLI